MKLIYVSYQNKNLKQKKNHLNDGFIKQIRESLYYLSLSILEIFLKFLSIEQLFYLF